MQTLSPVDLSARHCGRGVRRVQLFTFTKEYRYLKRKEATTFTNFCMAPSHAAVNSTRTLRLCVLAAVVELASASSPSCTIALKEQTSKKPCVQGVSFGCYQGGRMMWISRGCRGDFVCNGADVHCGTTVGILKSAVTGSAVGRNCTCLEREQSGDHTNDLALLPEQLGARRLNNDLPYGKPRFEPRNFDEALVATFAFWDLLDAIMFTKSPSQLYATGYVRELQIRRMIEMVREPGVQTYCEVGLNGGHSSVAMLLANPTLVVHAFDLLAWPYSDPVVQLLKLRFGNRFVVHPGSSHETLAPWAESFARNGSKCDLVFVDGDHGEAGAYQDMADFRAALSPRTRVVVDDIAVGPGCVMRRLEQEGVARVGETYGPYDAPAKHNPCMRGKRSSCLTWGFSVMTFTERALSSAEGFPGQRRKGANRGLKCWDIPGLAAFSKP